MNRERMENNKGKTTMEGCRCVCVRAFLGSWSVGVQPESAILTDFLTLDMHQEAHDSLI